MLFPSHHWAHTSRSVKIFYLFRVPTFEQIRNLFLSLKPTDICKVPKKGHVYHWSIDFGVVGFFFQFLVSSFTSKLEAVIQMLASYLLVCLNLDHYTSSAVLQHNDLFTELEITLRTKKILGYSTVLAVELLW